MKLTREAIQRMISQKQGTSNVTVINQDGGGGGGSVTLGPLLTSLNAEAMPSAEGYLHWTGSAWAFDTPTGGDPVDLTPYALKTWVQTNYASKDDIADFITESQAEDLFAAIDHTHANYLPLSAGPNKALTGSLYFSGNSGINWAGGVGMLACTPESGWTGISSSQWGVGALSAQGVIRSNANDILHYRNGNSYKIWDAYNFTPSDYLPLTGGTVESLTVTNGLDADSITVGSIVNSDTLAEYLDADAMQTWGDGRYLKLTDKAGLFTQLANYDGALQITIGGTQKSLTIAYANASGSANTAVNADKLDNHHAADFALASALGNYLPLTGGTLTGTLNINTGGLNISYNYHQPMTVYSSAVTSNVGWVGIQFGHIDGDNRTPYGGIRMDEQNGSLKRYTSAYSVYTIWDSGNFTPSNYLPLTGGTIESLTVTNGLDADSITVSSIVNSDTLAEYLDSDAMQTWGDGRYLKLTDKAGLFTQLANYDGALQITIGGTQKSLTIAYANAAGSANTAVNADKLDNYHAADFALASSLGNYLPLTGGTLTGTLNINTGALNISYNYHQPMTVYSSAVTSNVGWVGIQFGHIDGDNRTSYGGIRMDEQNGALKRYTSAYSVYTVWDSGNFTPSNYLPLTGGTVESLTVTNGLDADSITVSSIVNSDTLAEYLDQDASDARYIPLTGAATKSGNLTISGALYVNGNGGTSASIVNGIVSASAFNFKGSNAQLTTVKESATSGATPSEVIQYIADTGGRHIFRVRGSGSNELASIHAASLVFGNYTSDAAIYVEGGHIKARNASGTIVTII